MTRRARTKTRRPKFLSLRRQLASPPLPPIMSSAVADHLMDPDPSVACLLDADAGGSATIADLLGAGGSPPPPPPPESPSSSSMNWDEADDGRLARRALRGRERWVFCCSSPSTSSSEEVASGGAPPPLSLKLDYDEILAAWSGRGSLYIGGGEGPQVVPELHDAAVFVEVGNAWVVPGNTGDSREARVMRYKEKRRSRLFAKRIRYQVRKLNAEKRPRLKGRFVKKINDA